MDQQQTEVNELKDAMVKMGSPEKHSNSSTCSTTEQIDFYVLRRKGYSITQISEAYKISYSMITTYISRINRSIKLNKELKQRGLL